MRLTMHVTPLIVFLLALSIPPALRSGEGTDAAASGDTLTVHLSKSPSRPAGKTRRDSKGTT